MSNNAEPNTMKDESKRVLKPKLRFPEFRDAPGWTETKLADVLTEHGLKNDGNCKVHSVSVHKGIVDQIEHLGRSYAAADTSNYNLVKPHDIVYTKSPTGDFPFGIVKQSAHPSSVIVSPLYGVFSPLNKHLGYILDAYFESPIRTKNYLAPITQKGAKNTIQISNQTFLSKGIYLPSDAREHQQIAECLTSLDELIAAHSQKLDMLKAHKKGLMQQLFPGEGNTIPDRRFPEFRGGKAWTKRRVSEVLSKVSIPITVDPKTLYQEIGVRSHGKGIFHKEPISGVAIGDKRVFRVVEDALVLNIVFAWEQAVATTSKEEIGMIASHRFPMYVPKSEQCDVRFVKSVFLTPHGKLLLGIASPGGAGRNRTLGQEEFENLSITLPDKEEQIKIADTLRTADYLITSQAAEVETLKRHKQGLMQQLFPSPEDVET